MMELATQSEILLRDAQYETWSWTGITPAVTCFENSLLMGFVHVFESASALLEGWEARQKATLAHHAPVLRSAGTKAWNVYSVFLTSERITQYVRAIELIEEDFTLTRKIARSSVQTPKDLECAFLPLISLKANPVLGAVNFEARLRNQLKDVSSGVVTAFLSETPGNEVARLLGAIE